MALSNVDLYIGAAPRYAVASHHMNLLVSRLRVCFGVVFFAVALTHPGEGRLLKIPQWVQLFLVSLIGF
jgi:hypothetical protein